MKNTARYLLQITRPGWTGFVVADTGSLADQDCFITENFQFDYIHPEPCFCRAEFFKPDSWLSLEHPLEMFSEIGARFEITWQFIDPSMQHRTLILVSKFDHCLNNTLYCKQTSEFIIAFKTLLFNHPQLEPSARFNQVAFEVLSTGQFESATKATQKDRIRYLIQAHEVGLIFFAQYMQVLSAEPRQELAGCCITIHHSFLPRFKGARPTRQAFEMGVKAIGATAHYVPADLNEDAIIDQGVAPVDHTFGPDRLLASGQNMENYVLSRPVKAHSEHRMLLNGHKTMVLK